MNRQLLYALVLCAAGAGLEGICAGRGIRARFSELRLPRFSPPLWAWALIGVAYYVICFGVLHQLFGLAPTLWRDVGLVLMLGILMGNAAWNYLFFRSRGLFPALVLSFVYSAVALVFFFVLLRLDRTAALWWASYLAYLLYANLWGYRLYRLNLDPIGSRV